MESGSIDIVGGGGNVEPIFHCDAKPFALGPGVGLDPQRHNFALGYQHVGS